MRLLAKWKRQGRACSYCAATATTIDHVIPLIRGGTNYEGNLTPACRRCNSSKSGWLLTEWRTGRRCTVTAYVLPSPSRVRKVKAQPVQYDMCVCVLCSALYLPTHKGSRYCSHPCAFEYNARATRERYRAKVGLPPTWEVPVGTAPRGGAATRVKR